MEGAVPGQIEHVTGEANQHQGDQPGSRGSEPEFYANDAWQAQRCHADNPEAFAFEGELGINEARGERGQVERTGAEVEIGNEMGPERMIDLLGEMAQVENVNAEQSKQHEGLRPL